MLPKLILFITLLLSFLFRLSLAPAVYHSDLLSQAEWGRTLNVQGSPGYYQYNNWTFSWPNHPPLSILYYGWAHRLYPELSLRSHQLMYFLQNHLHLSPTNPLTANLDLIDQDVSPSVPFPLGYLLILKFFPILGDILIGVLLFLLTRRLRFTLIYLLFPYTWYLSSLWGQTDQIAFLLVFLSFILLPRTYLLSLPLLALGISFKPTSVFLLPLFLYLIYRLKPKISSLLPGILISFMLVLLTLTPFLKNQNFFDFIFHTLLPRLTDRPDRLTTNSYNFWHLFTLDRPLSGNTKFILLSGNIWGLIIYSYLNFYVFRNLKKISQKSIIRSFFIISLGFWLFLTNMLDRYAFAGVTSALVIANFYPKLLKYWFVLATVFTLNLFRSWWFPDFLSPLRFILTTGSFIAGLPLSLLNLFAYYRLTLSSNHSGSDAK